MSEPNAEYVLPNVQVTATFRTGLVRDEHVQAVVLEALMIAFGTANSYDVQVKRLVQIDSSGGES